MIFQSRFSHLIVLLNLLQKRNLISILPVSWCLVMVAYLLVSLVFIN